MLYVIVQKKFFALSEFFKKQGSQSTCFDKFVDVNLTRFFIRCILDTQLHVVRLSQIVGKGFARRINNVWSIIQVPSFGIGLIVHSVFVLLYM